MAIQLGSAYGKIALDATGLLSGVKKGQDGLLNLVRVSEQVGDKLKTVGKTLTIGLTLPIVAMGAASIKAASDFEETKNKALVVFDEMADGVVANANRAAGSLGVSKTQYLDYASSIGAALKAGGAGIQEVTELSEAAVKHFADLASFHNARVEDVSVAWQSAIRGQYEPIQRFFPFITNQYLITYGTANGMIDANTKTLTANQRAIILNAIALNQELNPALNDFAETSDGLANSTRIMKAQWNDALVLLGQNLLPIALKVVTAFSSMLEKFNALTPVQQKIVLGFLAFLAIIGPLLSAVGTLLTAVSSISGALGVLSTAGVSLAGIGTTVSVAVVPAVAALGAALLPVIVVIASLILIAGVLAIAWKTNFLGMRDNVTMWVAVIKNLWKALGAFLHGDTDAMLEYLTAAFDAFGARFNQVFERIFGIKDAWGKFMEFMRNALDRFVSFLVNTFTKIDWAKVGRFITLGLANGMLLGIPALIVAAGRAAESALTTIKRTLGISSPSKAFEKLGVYSAQGYQLGLAKAMSAEDISRTMARPVNQLANSQQQSITMQFASGVSVQQVRGMLAENNEQMMNTLSNFMGAG